jgi:hypothetical protein
MNALEIVLTFVVLFLLLASLIPVLASWDQCSNCPKCIAEQYIILKFGIRTACALIATALFSMLVSYFILTASLMVYLSFSLYVKVQSSKQLQGV